MLSVPPYDVLNYTYVRTVPLVTENFFNQAEGLIASSG